MIKVELKNTPDLKKLIQAADPSYKKRNAFVSAFSSHGVNINSHWDGGSRSLYAIVDIVTGQKKALPSHTHPFYDIAAKGLANQTDGVVSIDGGGNVTLMALPENYALVETGHFCGKVATAHVFLNPANMPKYLEAAKS
jgi:hypothetical protein